MEWYYASGGQQNGPVSEEALIALFTSGEVKGSDLVWNDTLPNWVPFNSIPEFADLEASPPDSPQAAPAAESVPSTASPVVTAAASTDQPVVPTYLWQSIVCLILCCLPAAIPAIIYATKVGPALATGDIAAAQEASGKAKMWCWISFGVGLAGTIIYLGLVSVGAIAEMEG